MRSGPQEKSGDSYLGKEFLNAMQMDLLEMEEKLEFSPNIKLLGSVILTV